MLRTAVLIFGCLVLLLGVYLCTLGTAFGGIQTLIGGAIFVLGTAVRTLALQQQERPHGRGLASHRGALCGSRRPGRTWKCFMTRAAVSGSIGRFANEQLSGPIAQTCIGAAFCPDASARGWCRGETDRW